MDSMTMKVLFIYLNPDVAQAVVPPYGIELLAGALRRAWPAVEIEICTPYLHLRPLEVVRRVLRRSRFDLVALSLRNLDDALIVRTAHTSGDHPIDTRSPLGRIRRLLRELRRASTAPVLVGGMGFAAAPAALLRELELPFGVVGPGEELLVALVGRLLQGTAFEQAMQELARDQPDSIVSHPAADPPPPPAEPGVAPHRTWADRGRGPAPRLGGLLTQAIHHGWSVPVRISTGCSRGCAFCVEPVASRGRVAPRDPTEVVAEIVALAATGVTRVWLSCGELNVPDVRHGLAILRGIAAARCEVRVSAFLAPAPVTAELLEALAEVGLDAASISYEFGHLDDRLLHQGAGPFPRAAIERLVELYLRRGHPGLAGSLIFGQPGESEASLEQACRWLTEVDHAFLHGLGLAYACGVRLYPNSRYGQDALRDPGSWAPHLYARGPVDPTLVRPVVFCQPWAPRVLAAWLAQRLDGLKGRIYLMNDEGDPHPRARLARTFLMRGEARRFAGGPGTREALQLYRLGLRLRPRDLELLHAAGLLLLEDLDRPREGLQLLEAARAACLAPDVDHKLATRARSELTAQLQLVRQLHPDLQSPAGF